MLARLARAGGTVAMAGVLVFAVPIQAQALLDPVSTSEFVFGAVRAAAPVEAAAGVVGPEGTLLVSTAVTIGALAYATRDTWMPWVSGLFGAGGTQTTPTPPAQTKQPVVLSLTVDPAPGGMAVLTGSPLSAVGAVAGYILYQCQLAGVPGPVITDTSSIGGWGGFAAGGAPKTVVFACSGGGSMVSVNTTSFPGWPQLQPSNEVSWSGSFDPRTAATYTVSSNCIKPDGSTGTITATTTNPGLGGLLVPSCVAAFGPGSHSTNFTVSGAGPNVAPKQLSTYPVPTDAQQGVLYPNCVGVGSIACTYIIDYQGTPCVVGQAECVNWSLRNLAHPSDYGCYYGPYLLTNIDLCAIDERAYEPNGTRLTRANTDGDPWTYDSPAPAGMPELPQPQPGTGTVTGTAPWTDTGTIPGGSTGVTPSPGPAPQSNGDCWSGGAFSWNPVDWVLTPIKCGLSWAFVPRTATVATLAATAKTDLTAKGIGPVLTAVSVNVGKVGGNGTGCAGPSVTFAAVGITKALTPFNACSTPMSTLASISYAVTTVVVVVGGGWAALVAIGAGFGFNMRRGGGTAEA
jgi:hypothetical protein